MGWHSLSLCIGAWPREQAGMNLAPTSPVHCEATPMCMVVSYGKGASLALFPYVVWCGMLSHIRVGRDWCLWFTLMLE